MQKSRPKINNYFLGGLHSDNDVQLQPPNTYRRSLNGRILFNSDGGYSWENDKGNKFSFTMVEYNGDILEDYAPIGTAEFADKIVIFSTNGTNSEIGYITINNEGLGTYQQVFNDKYDPNGDLLNFNVNNTIEAVAVKEAEGVERVYWGDGVGISSNERRCIDILIGDSFNYTPEGVGTYIWWYSVHSLARYADWSMGRIKYVKRIDGALKTGVYQYSYRMRTASGYATDWYPLTRHIIMNSEPIDESNSNNYQMQPSNITTDYGNQLQITGIDNRFRYIDVAYLYSIGENETVEAGLFHTQELFSFPTPSLAIFHTSHAAEPLNIDEFNVRKLSVLKAKTISEKDNRIFEANLLETGVLEPNLSEASLTAITRNMVMDDRPNDWTSKPFMHTEPVTTTVDIPSYTGASETYSIEGDYPNYKGTQWEHLFPSYWRGETYRFGVLLFDRKGIPNYVFHLDDYTFPEQYDESGDFRLTEIDGGKWNIKMMGLQVNGVSIPASVLYDNGELNVSGFSIVRAKRPEQTRFQGIITNTVFENNDETEDAIPRYQYTRPLPFTENSFDGNVPPTEGAYYNNSLLGRGFSARDSKFYGSRQGTFLMHSPDIMFGYKPSPTWQSNHRIKLVGTRVTTDHQENTAGYNRLNVSGASACHYYSKNYSSDPSGLVSDYNLGDTSFIDQRGLDANGKIRKTDLFLGYNIDEYDNQRTDLIYSQFTPLDFDNSGDDCCCCRIDKFSWGCPDSLLIIAKNFGSLHCADAYSAQRNRVFVANYQEPLSSYYGSENSQNSLETTVYQMCGHFQPITQSVIDDTLQQDGSLLFNGIEVWGGDCYPFGFDYTRLLPQYRDCETSSSGTGCQDYDGDCGGDCYGDYAVSMIVPLESNINFALRYGRQFAKDGTEPENTACGLPNLYKNGIQEKQREDFNINTVLMHEENVQFFPPILDTIRRERQNPHTVIYTESKIYGEPIDSYRINLANNFLDLNGKFGDATKLFLQYNFLYYLQEQAFGRLYVNERALLSSPDTGSILTGSSGILSGALYISTDVGCQHQHSVTQGHNSTYWVNVDLGKLYRFTQNGLDPISDMKGVHNLVYDVSSFYRKNVTEYDSPQGRGGIHGVYDYKNNELIMTWRRVRTSSGNDFIPVDRNIDLTLVYNEMAGVFTTEYDIHPHLYFPFRGFYFSSNYANNKQDFYVHLQGNRGEYYGFLRNSYIKIVVEPDVEIEKIYDGTMMNVNSEGVDILSLANCKTDYNSFVYNFTTDTRQKYRHGMLWFPVRGVTQTDRIRGKYMEQEYEVANADDKLCRITMIENKFRVGYAT